MPLGSAGLRPTAIRLSVLDALEKMPHSGVHDIVEAVQQVLGTTSRHAVADALDQLLVTGLVRRIEPAGLPSRDELRVDDNHHHVVCRRCGRTVDVDCAWVRRPARRRRRPTDSYSTRQR